ncbi:MAG: radical SAM protein, partial [Aigarchaeota archaeon]|nr:radical SAM protein [Aigarchaeota archaeon]
MVETIRVSTGTAVRLGLMKAAVRTHPTTAYLMMDSKNGCKATCAFCPQSSTSSSKRDMLARVVWPRYWLSDLVGQLRQRRRFFRRVCVQTLIYDGFFRDLKDIVSETAKVGLPISASCPPLSQEEFQELRDLALNSISIPVDGATPKIYSHVKEGIHSWEDCMDALRTCLKGFGSGHVWTHLIVGLGETEEEAVAFMSEMAKMGVEVALFAFTPIEGTELENRGQPSLVSYRRVQAALTLLRRRLARADDMVFSDGMLVDFGVSARVLRRALSSGRAFMT